MSLPAHVSSRPGRPQEAGADRSRNGNRICKDPGPDPQVVGGHFWKKSSSSWAKDKEEADRSKKKKMRRPDICLQGFLGFLRNFKIKSILKDNSQQEGLQSSLKRLGNCLGLKSIDSVSKVWTKCRKSFPLTSQKWDCHLLLSYFCFMFFCSPQEKFSYTLSSIIYVNPHYRRKINII